MTKNRLGFVFLIATFLVGIFFRLNKIDTNLIFWSDQGEDIYQTIEIYQSIRDTSFRELSLIGEAGTYRVPHIPSENPVYTGIFYFYMILPAAVLTSFSPVGMTIFFALMNGFSVIVIYLLVKRLVNVESAIIAAVLFATSYWMNHFSRVIWTPSMIPSFVLFGLYTLILIKDGRQKLWPLFAFLASAISQIHDSGYYYMALLLLAPFVLKVKMSKGTLLRTATLVSFMFPLAPTIIYEFMSGFKLFPGILASFGYQFNNLGILDADGSILQVLADIFTKFFGFWLSAVNVWQFDNLLVERFGMLGSVTLAITFFASALSVIGFFYTRSLNMNLRRFWLIFVATFAPIPFLVKVYYADNTVKLVSGGATFSLIGAIPLVIVSLSILLGQLWKRGAIFKVTSAIILATVVLVNTYSVAYNIWDNGDHIFDYGDKAKVVEAIGNDSKGKKFEILFTDKYDDGYGLLYLFDYSEIGFPVSFNGKKAVQISESERIMAEGEGEIIYWVIGRFDEGGDFSDWELIRETGVYKLYKRLGRG